MLINGVPIEKYGAFLVGTPDVSPVSVAPSVLYGSGRSSMTYLGYQLGLKTIECTVAFLDNNIHDIQLKRSALRAALLGKIDLSFAADCFSYFAAYESDADVEMEHRRLGVSKLRFTGIQHEPLERTMGKTVFCRSTQPKTDCRITVTVRTNAGVYNVGGVAFENVSRNDVLVVDGIDCRMTKNGVDTAASFTVFPQLVSGWNTIECPDTPTIEYYPIHM